MIQSLKRFALGAGSALLIALVSIMWAVPLDGAAHLYGREGAVETSNVPGAQLRTQQAVAARQREKSAGVVNLPRAARLSETRGRGLMVSTWVNGRGVYTFAVDTGAGATI